MDTEEISKTVDTVYKNILDKFNPASRQLISAGKLYLKALHGAAAASKVYVEALAKLARHSQQGTWGGCSDISSALLQVVDVYKEVHEQQMNILKAFYVDLLVPLETNLEKDTKVVQLEQKKFAAQHKQRSESHSKAAALSRKQRKKNKSGTNEKDLKTMQRLEEEQNKLDAFREQSLKTALTQERRRYGFVLERQCSLAKHFLSLHSRGSAIFQQRLPEWQRVARAREALPEEVQRLFTTKLGPTSIWSDDDAFSGRRALCDDEHMSVASALRKTRSMDASALDVRCLSDAPDDHPDPGGTLSRARSDLNLSSRAHSPSPNGDCVSPARPQSLAVSASGRGWGSPLARALYAYLSSGDNQLSFLEGDILALMGERNKGWQFGENLRTQMSGWFPLAYTELLLDEGIVSPVHRRQDSIPEWRGLPNSHPSNHVDQTLQRDASASAPRPPVGPVPVAPPPMLMSPRGLPHQTLGRMGHSALAPGPPPLSPAPHPHTPTRVSGVGANNVRRSTAVLPVGVGTVVGASLHSSNDSGFSNEPPVAPEVDYSDDEASRGDSTPRVTTSPTGSPGTEERVLSSVKGWLLYKSALDLWDDVDAQSRSPPGRGRPPPPPKMPPPPRPGSNPRDHMPLSGALTLPSNAKMRSRPLVPPPPLPSESTNGAGVVKRTRSLLKFRKDINGSNSVLEGMSLWKHRSLVDVREERNGSASNSKKSSYNSLEMNGEHHNRRQVNGKPPSTPAMKMKLVKIDIDDDKKQDLSRRSRKEVNGHRSSEDEQENELEFVSVEEQTYSTLTKHGAAYFRKRVLERTKTKQFNSEDEDPPYEDATEVKEALTDKKREAARRAAAEAVRSAALRRQFGFGSSNRLLTLPSRTRLAKSMSQELPPPQDSSGIFQYGKTLQSRLKAPERGSRFDRVSITTGNLCGPWYDMWGADSSVQNKIQ